MKNKGFTLIELMAIIVILGIVAVIVYSSVGTYIINSKIKSYSASTYGLIDVLNRYAIDKKATLTPFSGCSFDFSNETNSCDNLVYNGTLPSDGNVSVDSDGNVIGTVIFDDYVFKIINNEVVLNYKVNNSSGTVYNYSFTGDSQIFNVPFDGYYKVELWGAKGSSNGGNAGGYTSGIIGLNKSLNLYIYVGEGGVSTMTNFNLGGATGADLSANLRATDIRLVSGNWDDFDSLKSRIMVAVSGGDSSFISGHDGSDAISEDSTSSNIVYTGQSVHYSKMKFIDTVMIDGAGCKWTNVLTDDCSGMPTYDGEDVMMGNNGNGYAKITYIGEFIK